jgi:hypothetical protein
LTVATDLVPSAEEATADHCAAGGPRFPALADAAGKISGGDCLIGILRDDPSSRAHTGDFIHISGNGRRRQRKYHRRGVVGGDITQVGQDWILVTAFVTQKNAPGTLVSPWPAPVKLVAETVPAKFKLGLLCNATFADNRASGNVPVRLVAGTLVRPIADDADEACR